MERATLTVDEVAKLLGVGRNNAYKAIEEGKIPSIRIGKRLVVPKQALDRLLNGEVAGAGDAVGSITTGSQPAAPQRATRDSNSTLRVPFRQI